MKFFEEKPTLIEICVLLTILAILGIVGAAVIFP